MKHFFYTVLLLLICAQEIAAVSAYPKPIQITQPDGSSITITQRGDEHFHWMESTDGHPLIKDANGFLTYGKLNASGDLVASEVVAQNIAERGANALSFLASQTSKPFFSQNQLSASIQKTSLTAMQRAKTAVTPFGSKKILVVLMGFADLPFSKSTTEFYNQFNLAGYNANNNKSSVKEFFTANSYGNFTFEFDIMGPYTASQNMVYYGGNDSSGSDSNPEALASEAIAKIYAANPAFNFSQYVAINVIFAGYGEEAQGSSSAIWSHQNDFTPPSYCSIKHYLCTPEFYGNAGSRLNTIGVSCHELTHIIGSPDYYDTDNTVGGEFVGTGYWDLMASGNWNYTGSNLEGTCPANMTMYQKIRFGWVKPTVLDSTCTVSNLPNAGQNPVAYTFTTPTRGEKYVVENRQQVGYDAGIPGHGLLIYHIAKNADDLFYDINTSNPQLVYPVCASATTLPSSNVSSYGNINTGGCPFPGTSGKTSFTDSGIPSAKTWSGAAVNKPITNIVENTSTKTISFNFMDGVEAAPTPLSVNGTEFNNSNYILSWQKPSLIPALGDSIAEFHWDGNSQGRGLTSNQKTTFTCGQLYGSDQLLSYVGKKWNGIKFHITDATATNFTIELYKINSVNTSSGAISGTIVKSQSITGVKSGEWNEFFFPSPVEIASNTNYGVAIRYSTTNGYTPSIDKGSQYSSGTYNYGAFYTTTTYDSSTTPSSFVLLHDYDYNFNVRALINIGSPISYNIYRNNIKVANVSVLADTIALSTGTYCISLVNNGIESKKSCIDYEAPSIAGIYIYTKDNMAYVCGTVTKDIINIYTSSGKLYTSRVSKGTTEPFYLPAGIWIIKAGSTKKKVITN